MERDPDVIAGYLTDASNLRGRAEALFRPTTARELAAILRRAQADGVPVTPSAARTATTGSACPDGGWIVSLERMRAIVGFDGDVVVAQAGVGLADLDALLEGHGRFFPPDPTSWRSCTLGGAIATDASGARSFRYGATRRWVEALDVVLPTGDLLHARRGDPIPADWPRVQRPPSAVKSASGYAAAADCVDVFVGHEGTLGIVTQAWVRTLPVVPVVGLFVFCPDRGVATALSDAARRATRADASGAVSPRCVEYFDRAALALIDDLTPRAAAGAALFVEQAIVGDVDAHLGAWLELVDGVGVTADDVWVATDRDGLERMHAARHAVPARVNERLVRAGLPKIGTDLAVPDAAMSRMFDAYEAAPVPSVLFGHLGDNHLHLNLLPRSVDEVAVARAFHHALAAAAIAAGGTLSAEHGIGRVKKSWFEEFAPPGLLESSRSLKRRLDPGWILSRGVMFDAAPPRSGDEVPAGVRSGASGG